MGFKYSIICDDRTEYSIKRAPNLKGAITKCSKPGLTNLNWSLTKSPLFSRIRSRRDVPEETDDDEFPDVVSPSFTIIRGLETHPFPSHNKKDNTKNHTEISSGNDFYW